MKKITVLLLAFVIGISGFNMPSEKTAAAKTTQTVQKADDMPEVGLLKALGIVDKEADDINGGMTREDFAVSIARMINADNGNSSVRYFSDVEQTGYAVGAINALVDREIITLSEDGRFRPMENVTAQEAIKMLICVLGYGGYAEITGGYPSGYTTLAGRLDITDNVNLSGEFTKKSAYIMMYNALDTNIYKADSIDKYGNVVYSQDSETLMGEYHNIYKYEGTVTAVYGQNMNTSSMPDKDSISIDGVRYEKADSLNAEKYFGSRCKIWFEGDPNDDGGTVIYLTEKDNAAETMVIEPDMYEGYEDDNIIYRISDGSSKTKKLKLESANFIYNGTPLLTDYSSTLENINKGSITIKDSDCDDEYDLVIIEDFRNFVVGSINSDTIYNKMNAGESVSLEDYKTARVFAAAGSELDSSDIVVGNVLSIAESKDKENIKIIISTTEINGKASSVMRDEDELAVVIDGNEYTFDNSYYKSLITESGALKYNLQLTGYYYKLDHMNNICWIDTDSSGMKLGYILSTYQDEPGFEDMPAFVKLFTSTNSCERYECIKNVRVDGVSKKKYSDFVSAFPKTDSLDGISPQVIRYSLNEDGKITAIDTSNLVEGAETAESSMIARYDKPKTMWYNSGRLGVASYIDANTPIFYVPTGIARPSEDDIYCGPYSFIMVTDEKYTCNAYRFGSLTMSTGAVVCEYKFSELPLNRNNGAKVVMFDSVRKGVDSDGEVVQLVDGFSAGAKVEIQVPTKISLMDVEQGDIIRFYYDINGNVSENIKTGLPDMELICKRRNIYENNSPGWTNNTKYPNLYSEQTSAELNYYRAGIQFSYGFVNTVDGTLVGWGFNDGSTVDEIANIPGGIVIYDSSEREKNRIRTGTVADISDYTSAGDDCSRIIYHTRGGGYVETFIYR